MENKVQYTVTLKDLISGALSKAEDKAQSLEKTLGNLGKTAVAAFGAYEAFNFVKDSVKAFDEAAQASAKLDNQLQNSGRASDVFRAALDKQAESLMDVSLFDDDAITSGQSVLAGFKNISNELLMNATPAMVDVATAMKTDVATAATAVGMALESPADAARKLRSMNILLNDEQKKTIENMVKSGDKAKAQAYVLDLIANKYKGAGETAAKTGMGPFIVLQNKLGNVTESFGGVVISIVDGFMPAIKLAGDVLKKVTEFLTENKEEVKAVAIGIALAGAGFLVYQGYLKAAAAWTAIMTVAQLGLNGALMLNPVGLVVASLAALGAALYYAWNNFEGFQKFVYGVFEVIKSAGGIVENYLLGLKDKIIGTLTFDDEQVARGAARMAKAGELIQAAWEKGKSKGAANFAINKKSKGEEPILDDKNKTTLDETEKPTKPVSEPKGAPTTKATTITITIDKLVESLSVNTTNIQESTSKIRELVATALTDALNDSQIIAGG